MMWIANRACLNPRLCKLGVTIGLALELSACSMVYPELSTPVRAVPADSEVSPPPPPELVHLAVTSARIPRRTRDGRSWDKGEGAAPDAYAILFIDQMEVARTEVVSDSFEPKWPDEKPVNYKVGAATEVRVELWDDNVLVSHPICSQNLSDIVDAASVGTLEVNCESGAALEVKVEPAKASMGKGLYYEKRGSEVLVSRVVAASASGRAGLRSGDRIISVRGRPVSSLTSGELESILNAKGSTVVEVSGKDGEVRKAELREEAMYPVYGEGGERVEP